MDVETMGKSIRTPTSHNIKPLAVVQNNYLTVKPSDSAGVDWWETEDGPDTPSAGDATAPSQKLGAAWNWFTDMGKRKSAKHPK